MGRGFAVEFARRGANVLVNDVGCEVGGQGTDRSAADEVCKAIIAQGGIAAADYGDVVDDADSVVDHAVDTFGSVDVVVNNAGVLDWTPFADISAQRFREVASVHFDGSANILRAAWPHLTKSGNGRVVNMCSAATLGIYGGAAYSAGKAAIIGLTRTLALEGNERGINVNAVMPLGATRMSATLPEPGATLYSQMFPADAVAPVLVWLAHAATEVSGEILTVGGGRAARVLFGIAPGIIPANNTAEAWATSAADLLTDTPAAVPLSGFDEAMLAMRELGADLAWLESPTQSHT